ncbi:hypothetical protein [Micrococcus sp. HSID17245]|uniref:hypothetical protein n=1 Tax=Micrococcus sp. HSID17245 TaxID=2419508 RepID=UPI001293719C|nr:hypothetical protein [Micrococcus sp. HSID17245]
MQAADPRRRHRLRREGDAEALAALGVDLADAMALWRPAVEAGEEPSSWAVRPG